MGAGHYFGTSAGRSTLDTVATALDLNAKSNHHWRTNVGKTATGTGTTLCDPAYVQVTGHLKKTDLTPPKRCTLEFTTESGPAPSKKLYQPDQLLPPPQRILVPPTFPWELLLPSLPFLYPEINY